MRDFIMRKFLAVTWNHKMGGGSEHRWPRAGNLELVLFDRYSSDPGHIFLEHT